jgi:Bcr/CflA subfamily drug resistance transporter
MISLLVMMGAISQFASDNFLPSLPAIAIDLHAPATVARLCIALYLIGLCISQVIYGPLSDAYGRRKVILTGYVIFFIGCILVTTAHSITQLLLGRLIQAFGIGASSALFRAIMRDVFDGNQLAKVSSYLGIAFSIVPPLAPITGGYVQAYLGWRWNFLISLILAVILGSLLAWLLPETLSESNRRKRKLPEVLTTYAQMIMNRQFLGFTACSCFAFASIMIYVTISPFLFQHGMHLSPIAFGWLAPFTAIAYILGTMLNARLLNYFSSQRLLYCSSYLFLVAGLIMLVLALLGFFNIWVIILPLMLAIMATGFVFTNAFAGAFEPFPHAAGMAGALFASLQMLTAGAASAIAALLPAHTQLGLASMLTIVALLVVANVKWVLHLDKIPS